MTFGPSLVARGGAQVVEKLEELIRELRGEALQGLLVGLRCLRSKA